MRVLVVNAGSSSLKLRLLQDNDVLAKHDAPVGSKGIDPVGLRDAVAKFDPEAVGHRIVHGGPNFTRATVIEGTVRKQLEDLVELAPLHQPKSLAALDLVTDLLPEIPHVACFDTAFHARIPLVASTYAIPSRWRRDFAIRRYGFHGLSHSYAWRAALELSGLPRSARVVTCHLGSGASLAAIRNGRSLDTTMGFTPLEGLVMATRSGSIDPGMVLWLQQRQGIDVSDMERVLERESGLKGLAGSEDMQEVLRRVEAGDRQATLAIDIYVYRLRAGIAAMAATLEGLDLLVFTGGVGENAPAIRSKSTGALGFLGVEIDNATNHSLHEDGEISSPNSSVKTYVVRAREDLEIARSVRTLLR